MTATSTLTIGATPLPSTIAHLDALTATGGEGYLILSTIVAKKWRSASFATDQVDAAAQWAVEQDERGLNVYVRSTLLNRPLTSPYERGETVDTGAAVALVIDLDVAGPSHKPGATDLPLPPDKATAMSILAGLPAPSLQILTGDESTHNYWNLDEPEMDDPVGLIEAWADGIVEAGRLLGWHVDRPDPARVLRVCGTHRRKPGLTPNLVTMLDVNGWPFDGLSVRPWCPTGRFGARELLEALPTPPPVAPPRSAPVKPRRPDEFGPADAVARLAWSDILEPCGWSYVGTGRMGRDGPATERWKRPGATSEHSLVAIPDGPAVAFSDACGLPTGAGQKLTKFRVFAALHHNGDEEAAARAVRRSSRRPA